MSSRSSIIATKCTPMEAMVVNMHPIMHLTVYMVNAPTMLVDFTSMRDVNHMVTETLTLITTLTQLTCTTKKKWVLRLPMPT